MSRPKKRKGGRVTPKGTGSARPSSAGAARVPAGPFDPFDPVFDGPGNGLLSPSWADDLDDEVDDDPDVLALAGEAIATGHPAELLVLTSTFAEAVADASRPDPLIPPSDDDDLFSWSTVVGEFVDVLRPETTALLYALRPFAPDEWRKRITAELARRSTPSLPAWISSIGDVEVTGVWFRSHVSGDEDDVFIGCRWSTGQAMTVVVHLEHGDSGDTVEDLLFIPREVGGVLEAFTSDGDGTTSIAEVEPTDARTRLEAGVRGWEMGPRATSEDWPSARPLLLWLLSTLPDGGEGHDEDATAAMGCR